MTNAASDVQKNMVTNAASYIQKHMVSDTASDVQNNMVTNAASYIQKHMVFNGGSNVQNTWHPTVSGAGCSVEAMMALWGSLLIASARALNVVSLLQDVIARY
ncbi:hypothetical protein PoB_000579100 [Plakobranchus ocellatus]|uniref:Uncharacterized protein n=1 Tax=Plakobranchus ocellatus TaxID=259542 RepID=A0AAV3YA58_9GAST|nr:hypothetical protein PoB_000579100 [Plakobranchus ocellatus]